jgi:octaprenyl-diphosphate synthase
MRPASGASVTPAEDVPARNGSTRSRPPAVVALADVQAPIRDRLEDVKAELRRIVDDESPLIAGVSHHLLGMKGKLFRPTLVLLSSAATGDPQTTANTLAAVLELMHLATLVHDDAVDHSALRRGMPTLNALFSHQISVIAGDFLYLRALRELSRLGDLQALRVLTEASVEMTRGELRQLTYGDPLEFGERDYEALIGAKTAALFGAACEVGALCGAAEYRTELARYGERLGMAFQVIDDVLDYTSGQEVTGKPGGLDLRERKMTLPLIAAMREMGAAGRSRVESLFAAEAPSEGDIHAVIALVAEYGGIAYALRRGALYAQEAEQAIAGLPATPAVGALHRAIAYVLDRRS